MSVTTTLVRFQDVIDSSSYDPSAVQGDYIIVGTGVGSCVLTTDANNTTFITIGNATNAVPTSSAVTQAVLRYRAKKSVGTAPELEITASIGGATYTNKRTITNTSFQDYVEAIDLSNVATYATVDTAQITFRLTGSSVQISLEGVNSPSNERPGLEVTYTPLRWGKVLTSGSDFPVTTLTQSDFGPLSTTSLSSVNVVTSNDKGHFSKTGSLNYSNYTAFRNLNLNNGPTSLSQSLYISSSTITASIPQGIPIPDSGDFRSSLLMHKIQDGLAPRGRFTAPPTFAVENVLTYEGGKAAVNNSTLFSGSSTPAPFIPYHDEKIETPIYGAVPGDSIGFSGPNNGDVGYADFDFSNNRIKIERTSPKRGYDGNLQFYITASFSLPYSSSFGSPAGLEAYIVRYDPFQDYSILISDPIDLDIGGDIPLTGSFTGSWVIPEFAQDQLYEGGTLELRVKNKNVSRPVAIGFADGSGGANFNLVGEYNANLKPTFYFDINFDGTFIGEAWGEYSGSLSGVSLNDIPSTNALIRSKGIFFRKPSGFLNSWYGHEIATASIRLAGANTAGKMSSGQNISGLTFCFNNNSTQQMDPTSIISGNLYLNHDAVYDYEAITYTASLPGSGLQPISLTDQRGIQLDLSGSSGLDIDGGNGLHVPTSTVDSSYGLELVDGVINIKTGSYASRESGLDGKAVVSFSNGLALTSSLPGTGLVFRGEDSTSDRSIIDTASGYILNEVNNFAISGPGLVEGIGIGPDGVPVYANTGSEWWNNSTVEMDFYPQFIGGSNQRLSILNGSMRSTITNYANLGSSLSNDTKFNTLKTTTSIVKISRPSSAGVPWSRERGGFFVQTDSGKPTGSLFFYDKATISPVELGDNTIHRGGWLISSQSYYYRRSTYNPFRDSGGAASSATASFDSSSFFGVVQTVHTFDGDLVTARNPNNASADSVFYDSSSISQFGAIAIDTGSGVDPDVSHVWMFTAGG